MFTTVRTYGFSGNYVRAAIELAAAFVGRSDEIDARRTTLLVVRCTKTGVETHRINNVEVSAYNIFDNTIHGFQNAQLWRWNGRGFEIADDAARQRFVQERSPFRDIDQFQGWFGRTAILSSADGTYEYPFKLNGFQTTIRVQKARIGNEVLKTIDVVRDGHADRVLEVSTKFKFVSRSEYERFLRLTGAKRRS